MESLSAPVVSVILAVASVVTFVAYKHPKSYPILLVCLTVLGTFAEVVMIAWDAATGRAVVSVSSAGVKLHDVSFADLKVVEDAASAGAFPGWAYLALLTAWAYLLILWSLPHWLPIGDQHKKGEGATDKSE